MIPKNNGKLLPRLMKLMGAILFSAFACPSIAAGGDLMVSNGRAESGEQVTFTLAVNEAPNAVQAFRMDFEYDFTVLRFREAVPGTLAGREFEIFRAFNQAPGVVRVGGVAP
ncbi:MAG: cohesin domain-containing protein, partial [Desulfosudaceae bacterium]